MACAVKGKGTGLAGTSSHAQVSARLQTHTQRTPTRYHHRPAYLHNIYGHVPYLFIEPLACPLDSTMLIRHDYISLRTRTLIK